MRRFLMLVTPLLAALLVFPPAAAHTLDRVGHPARVERLPLAAELPPPMALHAVVHEHLHPMMHEHLHPVVHAQLHPVVHHLHHLVHQHPPAPGH